MNKYNIDEVLEMAVQTEKLGFQFYTSMAEKFKEDRALGSLFTTLAEKEQRHEKAFRDLKEMVGDYPERLETKDLFVPVLWTTTRDHDDGGMGTGGFWERQRSSQPNVVVVKRYLLFTVWRGWRRLGRLLLACQ